MFILKVIARTLILPPAAPLLLAGIGLLLIRSRRRWGWWVFGVGFASLWLFCTPIVAAGLASIAERCPPLDPDRPVNAQAVVVLGGGGALERAPEYKGAAAEAVLLERITLAAFLARHYSLPLAVSGAPSEALAMSQSLSRSFAVTPRWIEGHSRDTFENARLTAQILLPAGIDRIVLVTSSAHEWRAAQEFMAAGFKVTPAPAGVLVYPDSGVFRYIPSSSALVRSSAAVYELIGEPVRWILQTTGARERFDRNVQQVR